MDWRNGEHTVLMQEGPTRIHNGRVDTAGIWGIRAETRKQGGSLVTKYVLTHLATGRSCGRYPSGIGAALVAEDLMALPAADWSKAQPGASREAVMAIVEKHGGTW